MIKKIIRIIRLFSKSRKEPYFTFFNVLGFYPDKIDYYQLAMRHRSVSISSDTGHLLSNERLEFLGDAVLELIVTNYLYHKYPDQSEGDLTAYRSALVNTVSIGEAALGLGFNDYLKLSKGESRDMGRARQSILADTYEAFLGAIFLDIGYDECVKWVAKTLLIETEKIVKNGLFRDAKSLIQEKAQEKMQVTPTYKVISESGPDHDKIFVVGIYFNDKEESKGEGKSKQEAESDAAKNCLVKYKWI